MIRKKKLLFCSNTMDIGGIEKSLINLLDNIDYNKYEVDLILEEKKGLLLKYINNNVNVYEYRVSKNKNILIRKFINLFKRIKYILFNYNKYDFSCCYATYSLPNNFLARVSSKNSSIYVHSNYFDAFNKDKDKFKSFFNIRHINNFRKIIFVSNEMMDDFTKIYSEYKDKCIVINNFVDYKNIIKLSKEKIDISIDKNKKVFVFVGRIDNSSKNLVRLVNMFIKLKKDNENIELLIVGDGNDYMMINKLIDDNNASYIKMLGNKDNPYPYINRADYVILTSDYEGFPVIYNEAIVLNKEIITTINASDDYISIPNSYGFLVSKDIDTMVKEINDIINNNYSNINNIDFNNINNKRRKMLENIYDEVI